MTTNTGTSSSETPKSKLKPGTYYLPELPYGLKDLEPYISEQQLTLHYQKHHQAYINAANSLLVSGPTG